MYVCAACVYEIWLICRLVIVVVFVSLQSKCIESGGGIQVHDCNHIRNIASANVSLQDCQIASFSTKE